MSAKVKKNRINWRDFIFYLHNQRLSEEYTLFMFKHPNMSKNRCAYYVLKKNYSTTYLKSWRDLIRDTGWSIPDAMRIIHTKVF